MEYRTLGKTGLKVSVLGYGVSPLGNEFGQADVAEGVRAVHYAIDHGVNYFDVSPYYGRTLAEQRLGNALESKRDKVFIATKCGRYGMPGEDFNFSAERVTRSVEESLRRLRTDHVDVIQAHDVEYSDPRQVVEETIPALRKVQKAGKARFVGVTGLPLRLLRDIADRAGVETILSYCRYNLMITDMDEVLTPFCRQHGIGLINASPLCMRVLDERGAPDWHPAPQAVKDAGKAVVEVCRAAGVNVSDVALRFCFDHPYVATTLAGMSKQRHVEMNIRAVAYRPDPELMRLVAQAVAPVKDLTWPQGRPENNDDQWKGFA